MYHLIYEITANIQIEGAALSICYICGKEPYLPFTCSYCNLTFCNDHRIPEEHNCTRLPSRSWADYRIIKAREFARKRHEPRVPQPQKPTQQKKRSKKSLIFLSLIVLSTIVLIAQYSNPEVATCLERLFNQISNATGSILTPPESPKQNETLPKPPFTSSVNLTEIERLILKYTNIERKNHGLKELVWDEKLSIIAREHSEDMAENEFFDHINLKGENPVDRARRHGYPLYKDLGGGWYSEGISENIGKMTSGNIVGIGYVSNNADSIAKAQVESLMNSFGHRDTILDPRHDRLGVGVSYDGTYYITTQNFW